jgi:hypothetical protein
LADNCTSLAIVLQHVHKYDVISISKQIGKAHMTTKNKAKTMLHFKKAGFGTGVPKDQSPQEDADSSIWGNLTFFFTLESFVTVV